MGMAIRECGQELISHIQIAERWQDIPQQNRDRLVGCGSSFLAVTGAVLIAYELIPPCTKQTIKEVLRFVVGGVGTTAAVCYLLTKKKAC